MAATSVGADLTGRHRAAQRRIRAVALRDYARLWPLWQGDDETFERLILAALPLVAVYHSASAALAAAYYREFRAAEGAGVGDRPDLAEFDRDPVVASLYVTGRIMTRKGLAAGQSPLQAMQTALVRTSGTVVRHVLAGGRITLTTATLRDPRASGWNRIVSGGGCSFCQALAGKLTTHQDFHAHDHCDCGVEPAFS